MLAMMEETRIFKFMRYYKVETSHRSPYRTDEKGVMPICDRLGVLSIVFGV